jgi:drug/metabolite transporter (DMT)-like permease
MSTRESRLAYVAWITICLVWGTTFLAIRVALESLPVALLAGFRWMAAGLVLTLLLPFFRGEVLPPLRSWPAIAFVGFLMSVLGNGLVVWAEQYVASGLTAVVVGMVPFWSVAVEALSPGGERFTRRTFAGLVAGLAGIVVLVWPELTVGGQTGRMFVAGILALQIASLGWAIGTSYTKRRSLGTPLASSALQMLFSGTMLIALGTMFGEWGHVAFTARTLTAMIYLSLVGSVVGYTAYLYALKHLPISTVSLYAYVNPIIAMVLGTLLLSEPFSMRIVVAAAFVLIGIAIVRRAPAEGEITPIVRKAVA